MGSFSWLFADEQNTRNLRQGRRAYVLCPDNTIIEEPSYDGVGNFGGHDIYELVANWNREYLSQHPDFVIPNGSMEVYDSILQKYVSPNGIAVSKYPWYQFYANLSLTPEEVVQKWAIQCGAAAGIEYRMIGIDIACYSAQNAALPFPIKICKRKSGNKYDKLPASMTDPNDGFKLYKVAIPTSSITSPALESQRANDFQGDIRAYVRGKLQEISSLYKQQRSFLSEIPILPENHIIDEEKSVRWNREEVVRRNNSRKGKAASYKVKISKCETDIAEKIREYIQTTYKFGPRIAELIYNEAYEDGHAGGYDEVITYAEQYADFAEKLIDAME